MALVLRSGLRRSDSESFDEPRGTARLVWRTALSGMFALVCFVGLEWFTAFVNHAGLHGLERYDAPAQFGNYVPYVAAAVGAVAVFLALFFTTIGVIATTVYSDVPNEVRQLFVVGPTNRRYTTVMTFTLVVGVLLLATQAVHYQPHRTTLILFSVLVLGSILVVAQLTRALFRSFDLSVVAHPLVGRVRWATDLAMVRRRLPASEVQQLAHFVADEALTTFAAVVEVVARPEQRRVGLVPARLFREVVDLWRWYAERKGAVPTQSLWFQRIALNINWLTVDAARLNLALGAQTGISPIFDPDPQWVERQLGSFIESLLRILVSRGGRALAVGATDSANALGRDLAGRMQTEELEILHQALRGGLTDG